MEVMMSMIVGNWNNRYSRNDYAYGELPNNYLQEQLKKLPWEKYCFLVRVREEMRCMLISVQSEIE
jgi:hypothetical protein